MKTILKYNIWEKRIVIDGKMTGIVTTACPVLHEECQACFISEPS